jgi:predicted outer membrane protein
MHRGGVVGTRAKEHHMLAKLTITAAALCLLAGTVVAQTGTKLSDPQIAHIAYTAGQLDITAAKQTLSKSKNGAVRVRSLRIWSATTPR